MRKFFSILLCIVLIISICICSSVSGSALFIADDLLYSIGISMAASVLLSIGIAAVTGSDSQYVQFVEACGQLVWEQMVQDYTQAEILAMITIQNGKAYFKCPESLYHRLVNFANSFDWSSLTYSANLSDFSGSTIPSSTSYTLSSIAGHYVVNNVGSPLSLNINDTEILYSYSSGAIISFSDGVTVYHPDLKNYYSGYNTYVMGGLRNDGNIFFGGGLNGNSYASDIDNTKNVYSPSSFSVLTYALYQKPNSYASYNGSTYQIREWNNRIYLGDTIIANISGTNSQEWAKGSIFAGRLLVNVNNPLLPINSNNSLTTYSAEVETEVLSPAIPGNRVGSDQSVLVPVPSNIVDPAAPDLPLTQSTVKKRVKRGQAVALVPDLPSLQDKTPQDLGVLVVNNTEIEDTVISPTLSTTYIGENSTTFVIIPDNPGSTPIPNDDNEPLVSSPYPDVINPGNETISINASDDVFPTASNPPATTARPSVSVSNPDEVASSAVGEVVEGVSDIVKEGVSELVEPLSPSDIEKGANRMKLTPQLLSKFPFCIPFDFYNAINQFSAPAEVPQFDIPIIIDSLNFHYNVHVDLTQYETAAKISRWLFSVAWVITLIFLTRKVIWK